jgi:hypothetical protein
MPPALLLTSLESVRRRVRWLTVLFGTGLVLAAGVGLIFATVLLDYLLNLHAIPRVVLILLALSGLAYALWRWVIQSILARLTLNEVAGRLEKTFPQYQDRLRSTIDILTGVDVPGSEIMKQRVVSEATRLTQSLDLGRVVVARPVWYSTSGGLAAVVLGLVIAGSNPQYARIAFDRLLTPFSTNPWPKQVVMDLVGDVPARVSVGQRVDINIRLSRGDKITRKSTIYYQYGDGQGTHFGPVEQEYMTRGDDGIYHASVDARTPSEAAVGSIKIWMESGDDRMELAPVRVVQRLTIDRVTATITAPPYAKLPSIQVNLSQNPALMTVGSTVRLTALFNKPLDLNRPVMVELLSGKTRPQFIWAPVNGNSVTAAVTATESFRFHLHAIDTDGLSNTAAEEFEFVVRPDQSPSVMIENPRRNEDRTPEATVPFQAVAEDDFGIDSLKLVVDRVGDKKHWEIPLVTTGAASAGTQWNRVDAAGDLLRYRANYAWDLTALQDAQLKSGDVLEYYALVKDNYELNGQSHAPVASGKLRIVIISQDEFDTKITDELSSIAEQTAALKQSQRMTQRQTATLSKEVAGKAAMDDADKVAADRLANQQSTIASQTKSLANKLTEMQSRMVENKSSNQELKDTARDVGDLLTSAAENPMKNAAGQINTARQAPAKPDRDQALTDAQTSQAKAGDDLQKVLDRMGSIGSLSRSIENVRNLLAEQQKVSADTAAVGKNNLGKTPDQMSAEDQKKLGDLAKQQADLGQRTDKALDQIARDAQKLQKSDPSASSAMSQAADTGKQQNVPGKQAKAADATQENQQGEAQSQQKQAELGLQMMLADLREAEKHKLDELARKLSELQQQVAILIREQAGHNLDNLTLQGGNVLASTSDAVKMDLFTKAERDPKDQPPLPEIGILSSSQEQTERNTRDIAKSAEDLPDGAEPADHLTQAADKMERAIVNLRDDKLGDAYNPAMVDALEQLVEAKKLVDQQKHQADKKQEDQKKESIRQAYMALLAQQNEVNARTVAVDGSSKNDDGSMTREALVRLGQLPGDQGKLADTAAKMDEDLSALGSIVYSWANRQIVKNMNEVKDQLGQQQTGAIIQAQQKQIVDQLDAMIRDLATKPEESKFAQHDGDGGGGGGGGQQDTGMPTEAELRLIKDLQIAENDATTTIGKQPQPAKTDTLSLGNRQGDLRDLMDKLLQKASKGQSKLPPEPDNRDQLPEEAVKDPNAAAEKVDNQELDQDLLDGDKSNQSIKPAAGEQPGQPAKTDPQAQHDLNLIGDRMARARQRLAINSDPGPITQEVQKRILDNMDDLIEQARKKEAQAQNKPPEPGGKVQQQQPPKPTGQQPQDAKANGEKPGLQPARTAGTSAGGGDAPPGDPTADLAKQEARMWGNITPRQRDAVIESQGEKVLDKYQKLVDDYYRTLSTKANGH